jgi:hypothetical protein
MLILSLAGPLLRVAGKTQAAACCAVIVVAAYWGLTFVGVFVLLVRPLFLLLYWMVTIPVLLVTIATTLSLARRQGSRWAISSAALGFAWCFIGMAGAFASKPHRAVPEASLEPGPLSPEILTIAKCAQEFASSHPDAGYAESPAQMAGCVPYPAFEYQKEGFTIRYQPGPKDPTGKVTTYLVTARETSPKTKGLSTMFSDESGLTWIRYDGPQGTRQRSLFLADQFLSVLASLVDAARQPEPFHTNDPQTGRLIDIDREKFVRLRFGETHFVADHKVRLGAYTYEYEFLPTAGGALVGFYVERSSPAVRTRRNSQLSGNRVFQG